MSAEYFSTVALQKHVNAALEIVPAEHRHCVVGYLDSEGVYRVAYAARIGHGWKVGGQLEGDLRARKVRGEIVLERSW